jgi:hypothetical protein
MPSLLRSLVAEPRLIPLRYGNVAGSDNITGRIRWWHVRLVRGSPKNPLGNRRIPSENVVLPTTSGSFSA